MKNFLKKLFLSIMLLAAVVWIVHTALIFWDYVGLWSGMQITGGLLLSHALYLLIKNIPSLLAVIIASKKWGD